MTVEDEFDAERLRVKAPEKKNKRRSEPFYPAISEAWLKEMLGTLETKGIHVTTTHFAAVQAVFRAYLEGGSKPSFTVSPSKIERCYYINEKTFRKILGELRDGGLITIEMGKGKKTRITLLFVRVIK